MVKTHLQKLSAGQIIDRQTCI